jgi:hypothetical protein
LSRAYEKTAQYEASFDACTAANRTQKTVWAERINGEIGPRTPETIARLQRLAATEDFSHWPTAIPGDCAPVFLLGFPRSGTTLLDQILSSHEEIEVIEEQENLIDAWMDLVVRDEAFDRLRTLSAAEIDRYQASYWSRIRSRSTGRKRILIDKLPLDTVLLGLIHRIFPDSKILFVLRDPRDAVLSCYQQNFAINSAMYQFLELETAASYYDAVMTLGETWRARLPLNLHVVRYENVVANLRREIEPVLTFLGVSWNEALLRYNETALGKVVRTPSAKQVIEPLYASSIGKWRRYEAQLAPVLPVLNRWAARFGYVD